MMLKGLLATGAACAALMMAGAAAAAPNIIVNGGFETPYTGTTADGFTSQYTYVTPSPNALIPEGTFTIASDPSSVHPYFKSASGSNLLIVNGDDTSATPFVYTSNAATVGAGTYHYSFDLGSVCCNASFGTNPNNAPTVNAFYSLNGGAFQALKTTTAPAVTGTPFSMQVVSGDFNIASGGNLQLRLTNNTDKASGNDFAIDNVSVSAAPEPGSWSLMIAGVGFAGFALRSSRRRTVGASLA